MQGKEKKKEMPITI